MKGMSKSPKPTHKKLIRFVCLFFCKVQKNGIQESKVDKLRMKDPWCIHELPSSVLSLYSSNFGEVLTVKTETSENNEMKTLLACFNPPRCLCVRSGMWVITGYSI